jgi:hypothetical protein
MIAYLPFIPGFLLHVMSWFFPKMRKWTCHQCGTIQEIRLNKDSVPAMSVDAELNKKPNKPRHATTSSRSV